MKKNVLGAVIKAARKKKKITQKELSELTGYNQNTISNHENGNRSLGEKEIQIYSTALNISPDELFEALEIKQSIEQGIMHITEKQSDTDRLLDTYKQLNEERQEKVYHFATKQLEQQNSNVTSIEDYKKDDCLGLEIIAKVSAGKGVYNFLECDPKIITLPSKSVPCSHFDYAFEVSGDSMEPTFKDGEIIFIKEDKHIRNGQIGVVEIDFELFVKKMYLEDDKIRLVSLNTDYDDIIADGTNEINVIGKVVM